MNIYPIHFPDSQFPAIYLKERDQLAEKLTVQNSPILFGCRTGLCGTCLVSVTGHVPPPSAAEKEILQILAPHNPQARLACQIQVNAPMAIARYGV